MYNEDLPEDYLVYVFLVNVIDDKIALLNF